MFVDVRREETDRVLVRRRVWHFRSIICLHMKNTLQKMKARLDGWARDGLSEHPGFFQTVLPCMNVFG
jgi:hypothetical protein